MKMASDAQKFAKFRQFFVNFSVQKIFIFCLEELVLPGGVTGLPISIEGCSLSGHDHTQLQKGSISW